MEAGGRNERLVVGRNDGTFGPEATKADGFAVDYERGLDGGPTVAFAGAKVPSGDYTGPLLAPPAWPR